MSEKSVQFRDNQEVQADDFNNLQNWQSESLDHVVGDAVTPYKAYTGFAVTKSAQTSVSVSPGRHYSAGLVYAYEDPQVIDLFNYLPVVTQRIIAIVAYGQEVQEDVQPRDFLIDANTGQTQPQAVSMRMTRSAVISTVLGVESSNPQVPTISANVLPIAMIRLDSSGVSSITQLTVNQLPNVQVVNARVSALEIWRGILAGQIDTLKTDLANLAASLVNYTPIDDFQRLASLVAEMYKKLYQPGIYVFYGTDEFVDESLSYTAGNVDGVYSALIDEGLRMPGGAAPSEGSLALYNSSDPMVLTSDGFILPKPSGSRVRLDNTLPHLEWFEHRILQHTHHASIGCRRLHHSRYRHRCGHQWTVCPEATVWWYHASKDPSYHILSFNGETWEISEWAQIANHSEWTIDWPRHYWDRWTHYWRDWVHIPYWRKTYVDHTHSGSHMVQTFLNAQDGWVTSVTVFSHTDQLGPLTLLIAGTDEEGSPDHIGHTLARVDLTGPQALACLDEVLTVGDILVPVEKPPDPPDLPSPWPPVPWGNPYDTGGVDEIWGDPLEGSRPTAEIQTEWRSFTRVPTHVYGVRIPVPPTFLQAGERYGVHLISTFDHRFSFCHHHEAFGVCQGHFWYSHSDGQLIMHSGAVEPRFLRFKMHFATWARFGNTIPAGAGGMLRYDIQMQPLQKVGGIRAIDILAGSVVPPACGLNYEVQVGGTWEPFRADPASPNLTSNPAVLNFRVVFTGTTDVMPSLTVTPSQVTLHGPMATGLHHISEQVIFGSNATSVKVIVRTRNWIPASHTLVCTLNRGADITETSDVTPAPKLQDDGSYIHEWTFTGLPSIPSCYIILDGTVSGGAVPFVVAQESRYATA